MPNVLILNPLTREGTTMKRNRKGQFIKGHSSPSRRRHRRNPVKHRAAASHGRIVRDLGGTKGLAHLPRGTYRVNRMHKRRRHLRRNPIALGGMMGLVRESVFPAIGGAGAGIVVDLTVNYLAPNLPVAMQTPMAKNLVKLGVAAFGIPLLGSFFLTRRQVAMATTGALVVIAARMATGFLQTQFPTLPLSGVSEYVRMGYVPRAGGSRALLNPGGFSRGMAEYVPGRPTGASMTVAGVGAV